MVYTDNLRLHANKCLSFTTESLLEISHIYISQILQLVYYNLLHSTTNLF